MKNLFIALFIFLLSVPTIAQEAEDSGLKANVGLQITSRHYWRGIPVSSAPCFEGSLALTKGNFTIGYWGGYAFDKTYSEFDIFGSYSIGNLTLSFTDLYVISDETTLGQYHPEQKYWDFDKETTRHNFDVTASYNFGKSFPLTLSYSTMVWGCDVDANGDNRYSNYVEAKYPFSLVGNTSLNLFCGMTLNDKPAAYGDGVGVVNMGVSSTKVIQVSDKIAFPVTATVALNPQKEIGFVVFAIGI